MTGILLTRFPCRLGNRRSFNCSRGASTPALSPILLVPVLSFSTDDG